MMGWEVSIGLGRLGKAMDVLGGQCLEQEMHAGVSESLGTSDANGSISADCVSTQWQSQTRLAVIPTVSTC